MTGDKGGAGGERGCGPGARVTGAAVPPAQYGRRRRGHRRDGYPDGHPPARGRLRDAPAGGRGRAADRLRRAARARPLHAAALQSLRRAAARPAGSVGLAAVRAGRARRQALRPRRRRQQGRHRGAPRRDPCPARQGRQIADHGQVDRRGRGGDRERPLRRHHRAARRAAAHRRLPMGRRRLRRRGPAGPRPRPQRHALRRARGAGVEQGRPLHGRPPSCPARPGGW